MATELHYLEHAWILTAWKIWRGECSVSWKNAMCWWFSVTLLSQKSAHRMQLLLHYLYIGYELKTSKKGIYHRFIPKWAIPVSSQKPKDLRNRQKLSFVSGDRSFVSSPVKTWRWFSFKIQLEPLQILDCRVTDGGFSAFCYVWQSCDPSCLHGVVVHVEDYQEGEVRVQSLHGTDQYGRNIYLQFQAPFSSILSDWVLFADKPPRTSGSSGFKTSFQPHWPSKSNLEYWK